MLLIETKGVLTILKTCFGFCIMCLYVKVIFIQGVYTVRSVFCFLDCLLSHSVI
jgi:hypothetical protein